jgi:hypothetical protein
MPIKNASAEAEIKNFLGLFDIYDKTN